MRGPLIAMLLALLWVPTFRPEVASAETVVPPPVLPLPDAIEAVLRANPQLEAAEARLAAARTLTRKAWAGYLPQVTAAGVWTRNSIEALLPFPDFAAGFDVVSDPPGCIPGVDPDCDTQLLPRELIELEIQRKSQLAGQLEIQQPLFVGPLIPAIKNAGVAAEVASLGTDLTRRELVHATAQAYLGAAGLKEAIRLGQEQVTLVRGHLRSAEASLEAGMVAELAVLRARIEVGRAEQDLARAHAAYAAARGGLALLMAREDIEFEVELPDLPGVEATDRELGALLTDALGTRPDLRIADLSIEMNERSRLGLKAKFLPTVAASWTWRYSDVTGFTDEHDSWALMLVASIPLYDGGLRYAELREADARIAEAHAQRRSVLGRIRQEVRQALLDIEAARANIAKAEEQVALARANWKAVEASFGVGASSAVEVSDAAAALRGAELARVSEGLSLQLAQLSLRKALGLPIVPRDAGGSSNSSTGPTR